MQFEFTEIGKCGRNGKLWESVPKLERFVANGYGGVD